MSMYGQEIARVHAHDNGYTVETKTKKLPPRKDKSGANMPVSYDHGDTDPMPGHGWESSVAKSKQDVLDRIGAAHAAHQDVKMRGQYQKLNKK